MGVIPETPAEFEARLRETRKRAAEAYATYAAIQVEADLLVAKARDLVWRGASITGYPQRHTGRLSKFPDFVESSKHGLILSFGWSKYLGGGEWEARKPIQFPARFLAMPASAWEAELRARVDEHKARKDARKAALKASEALTTSREEEEARLRAEAKEWETFKTLQAKYDPYAT